VFDDHGVEITRLMANEGYFDGENWVFLQGRETSFSVADGEPVRSLKFDEKAVAGFREKPRLMIALEKKPKDLSLFELREILDKLGGGADPRVNAYAVRSAFLSSLAWRCRSPLPGCGSIHSSGFPSR
jgi:hypothetical protein